MNDNQQIYVLYLKRPSFLSIHTHLLKTVCNPSRHYLEVGVVLEKYFRKNITIRYLKGNYLMETIFFRVFDVGITWEISKARTEITLLQLSNMYNPSIQKRCVTICVLLGSSSIYELEVNIHNKCCMRSRGGRRRTGYS